MLSRIDRLLRSLAYDVLTRRDGSAGWQAHRASLRRSLRKTVSELTADSNRAVHRIVSHAFATVPYYRSTWQGAGLSLGAEFGYDDLQRLPFLTKEAIRREQTQLVSEDYAVAELRASMTGGTTGVQTTFYLDRACAITRFGRQWGILEHCGYRPGLRRGLVWGVHDDLLNDGPFSFKRWFRQFASSQETLCCTVLNDEIMRDYLERLRTLEPDVLYGYPNALSQLARFAQQSAIAPQAVPQVATIITTAERLSSAQRSLLSQVFGGEVFNLYCSREHGCVGFECKEHRGFHIDVESVAVEIIRDGERVPRGETGEITITDLRNRGMPFIRSRTGDVGALAAEPCPCGLPQPLLESLDGRAADVLYRPDGSSVAGLMLTDLFTELPEVKFAQFIQDRLGTLDVLVVANEGYSAATEQQIKREVAEVVGPTLALEIRRVADIPRNPRSGKFQEVICRIAKPDARQV